MNVIMLTGRVKTTPELKQSLSGVQHAHFVLEVSHRTAGGRTKREDYPVQAWHNRARFAAERLCVGMDIGVTGYLTLNRQGMAEVVAEEFLGVTALGEERAARPEPAA